LNCLDDNNEQFPHNLSTALYETGGDVLGNRGIMRSLIKVINYYEESQDFIQVKCQILHHWIYFLSFFSSSWFVTRADRVVDLISSFGMTSIQVHNGLQAFISCLELS
jgi:hypothetical protein